MEERRIIMNEIMRNLKKVLEKENLNKNSFNKIYFLISKNNIEFNLEFSDIDEKDIENICQRQSKSAPHRRSKNAPVS